MNLIDTSEQMLSAFDSGRFALEKWEAYMDAFLPKAKAPCLADMRQCLKAGFCWETDFFPVLNAVYRDQEERKAAIRTFRAVTEHLERKLIERFGRSVETDLILYLGLCNGAGWVTTLGGRSAVLFGIEKIMELGWYSADTMNGLVLHELGHVYQAQYGVLERETHTLSDRFLWQMFTEGVAMVFEQELVGDAEYYHQDADGWKQWCDRNAVHIARSFQADLTRMTPETQRYFGDWVRFEGRGDVGYYLGARFVRYLLACDAFDRVIGYEVETVAAAFADFLRAITDERPTGQSRGHIGEMKYGE